MHTRLLLHFSHDYNCIIILFYAFYTLFCLGDLSISSIYSFLESLLQIFLYFPATEAECYHFFLQAIFLYIWLCAHMQIFLEERLRVKIPGQKCAHTHAIISLELKTHTEVRKSQNEKCWMRLIHCISDNFLALILYYSFAKLLRETRQS